MRKKIVLTYKDIEGNIAEETIWTIQLDNGNHKVDNIPFYAMNIALDDIVSVEIDDGIFYFNDLIEPSGHSTIQIIFFEKEKSKEILSDLEKFGCKWEGMNEQPYYAVDVPTDIDYGKIKTFLNKQLEKGILDYKESCLSLNHAVNQ